MKEKIERRLYYKEQASHEEEKALFEGTHSERISSKKKQKVIPFSFFIKDANNKLLGGIKGISWHECLHIDILWVDSTYKIKGWDGELLHAAENLGRKRKCSFSSLKTMDPEVLDFYKKLGYEVEYIREGKESKMYLLSKNLL